MMKKITAAFLFTLMIFTLSACGNISDADTNDLQIAEPQSSEVAQNEVQSEAPEILSAPENSQEDNDTGISDVNESINNSQVTNPPSAETTANESQTVVPVVSEENGNTNAGSMQTTTPPAPEVSQNKTQSTTSAVLSTPENSQQNGNANESGKILIAYFSRVGNTNFEANVDAVTSASIRTDGSDFIGNCEVIAQTIHEQTGGDLFFIKTMDKYPSAYRDTTDQASIEQANNARPALSSHVENMDAYDTVILVYPNWWGTLPQPVFTFLEEYDFSGKTILPLCTHGGSAMGSSARDIASLCPDARLLNGLAISGSNVDNASNDIAKWLSSAGIVE